MVRDSTNHANLMGTNRANNNRAKFTHGTDHANTTPHGAANSMPIFQNGRL